jgi:hypothetical protein
VAGPDDLRRLALALPEACEEPLRGTPAFRVNRKIFAMLAWQGGSAVFAQLNTAKSLGLLKLHRDDQLSFIGARPEAIEETESYGHHGWTYAWLDKLDEATLETLLWLAWMNVAPKRLSKTN